jgi:hypothetical protein
MSRNSPNAWDTKPGKPIRYGLGARFADRFAGRGDGNAAIPDLPTIPTDGADPQPVTTPYLDIRRHHFLDSSERERRHMLKDLEPVYHQLAAVRQKIAGGMEKVDQARKRLADIPQEPDDAALNTRNVLEQHIHPSLVHARRRREHHARRAPFLADEQQATADLRALQVEEARLVKVIATRKEILNTRVQQLHKHTLRRCGTYRHHLVRKHPDGAALISFLDLALPSLPDWLQHPDPDIGSPAKEPDDLDIGSPAEEPGTAAHSPVDLGPAPSVNGHERKKPNAILATPPAE